jgi:hypothetical protein
MLYHPFYDPLKQQVKDHGWHILYDNNTGFLNLPSLTTIFKDLLLGTIDMEVVVKLIFPLLAAVGLLQTFFLGYHIMYVTSALTTLEYKIILERQYQELMDGKTKWKPPINPFDQGWYQNIKTILGPLPLILLPLSVDPSPISIQTQRTKKKN